MYKVNKYGRSYKIGTPLCPDLRNRIIELAQFSSCRDVSRRIGVSPGTVSNIVKRYRETGSTNPQQRSSIGKYSKVSFDDSVLLETIVQAQPSSCLDEMKRILAEYGKCGTLSSSTIFRHIRKHMPSNIPYSRKRLEKLASERFTHENMVYTQLYIDHLAHKDPETVKFFDESGFQLPSAGHQNYGYSYVGQPCVEIRRYLSTCNHTLNLLIGLDGVKYANVIQGASNSLEFLRFFDDASTAICPATQRPALEVGDTIVVDNLAAHHGDAERALREYFNDLDIELLFTPVYSPDLNPVEEVFSKLKYLLKYRYQNIVFDNLEYAILKALGDVTLTDLYGYYRQVGYLL